MLTVIGVSPPSGLPDIEIRTPLPGRLLQAALLLMGACVATLVTVALAGRGTSWAVLAGAALAVWPEISRARHRRHGENFASFASLW